MWNMNNLVMCCLKDSYKRCFILSDYYFEIKLQADRNYLLKRFFKFQMNLIFNELYILFVILIVYYLSTEYAKDKFSYNKSGKASGNFLKANCKMQIPS